MDVAASYNVREPTATAAPPLLPPPPQQQRYSGVGDDNASRSSYMHPPAYSPAYQPLPQHSHSYHPHPPYSHMHPPAEYAFTPTHSSSVGREVPPASTSKPPHPTSAPGGYAASDSASSAPSLHSLSLNEPRHAYDLPSHDYQHCYSTYAPPPPPMPSQPCWQQYGRPPSLSEYTRPDMRPVHPTFGSSPSNAAASKPPAEQEEAKQSRADDSGAKAVSSSSPTHAAGAERKDGAEWTSPAKPKTNAVLTREDSGQTAAVDRPHHSEGGVKMEEEEEKDAREEEKEVRSARAIHQHNAHSLGKTGCSPACWERLFDAVVEWLGTQQRRPREAIFDRATPAEQYCDVDNTHARDGTTPPRPETMRRKWAAIRDYLTADCSTSEVAGSKAAPLYRWLLEEWAPQHPDRMAQLKLHAVWLEEELTRMRRLASAPIQREEEALHPRASVAQSYGVPVAVQAETQPLPSGAAAASSPAAAPDALLCAICGKESCDVLLSPCMHVTCCQRCALQLMKDKRPCPRCSAPIQRIHPIRLDQDMDAAEKLPDDTAAAGGGSARKRKDASLLKVRVRDSSEVLSPTQRALQQLEKADPVDAVQLRSPAHMASETTTSAAGGESQPADALSDVWSAPSSPSSIPSASPPAAAESAALLAEPASVASPAANEVVKVRQFAWKRAAAEAATDSSPVAALHSLGLDSLLAAVTMTVPMDDSATTEQPTLALGLDGPHLRRCRVKTGVVRFTCSACARVFEGNSSNAHLHMTTHHNVRNVPVLCEDGQVKYRKQRVHRAAAAADEAGNEDGADTTSVNATDGAAQGGRSSSLSSADSSADSPATRPTLEGVDETIALCKQQVEKQRRPKMDGTEHSDAATAPADKKRTREAGDEAGTQRTVGEPDNDSLLLSTLLATQSPATATKPALLLSSSQMKEAQSIKQEAKTAEAELAHTQPSTGSEMYLTSSWEVLRTLGTLLDEAFPYLMRCRPCEALWGEGLKRMSAEHSTVVLSATGEDEAVSKRAFKRARFNKVRNTSELMSFTQTRDLLAGVVAVVGAVTHVTLACSLLKALEAPLVRASNSGRLGEAEAELRAWTSRAANKVQPQQLDMQSVLQRIKDGTAKSRTGVLDEMRQWVGEWQLLGRELHELYVQLQHIAQQNGVAAGAGVALSSTSQPHGATSQASDAVASALEANNPWQVVVALIHSCAAYSESRSKRRSARMEATESDEEDESDSESACGVWSDWPTLDRQWLANKDEALRAASQCADVVKAIQSRDAAYSPSARWMTTTQMEAVYPRQIQFQSIHPSSTHFVNQSVIGA